MHVHATEFKTKTKQWPLSKWNIFICGNFGGVFFWTNKGQFTVRMRLKELIGLCVGVFTWCCSEVDDNLSFDFHWRCSHGRNFVTVAAICMHVREWALRHNCFLMVADLETFEQGTEEQLNWSYSCRLFTGSGADGVPGLRRDMLLWDTVRNRWLMLQFN